MIFASLTAMAYNRYHLVASDTDCHAHTRTTRPTKHYELLQQCGWIVQDRAEINLGAGRGRARVSAEDRVRRLSVIRRTAAIGAIEAKAEGIALAGVESQAALEQFSEIAEDVGEQA
jgi:hypothetical protein